MKRLSSSVLIVSCIDPVNPVLGGIETYSRNLIEYLLSNKVDVTLLGVSYNDSLPKTKNYQFIPILHKKISGYNYLIKLCIKTPFIRIPDSTIIYAQSPEYMLPFVIFHKKNPKVIHLHGNLLKLNRLERSRLVNIIYKIVESFVLKHANLVITTDEGTMEYYKQEYPWVYSKMMIIPIGINLDLFKLLDRDYLRKKYRFNHCDKVIMYLGRLTLEKNLKLLLQSYSIVKNSVPATKLVFVGEGREEILLKKVAEDLKLKNIYFMGAIEPDKVPEILNCADILALCSLTEGSSTVIKEALACGVPVVSTPVGDVSKIITNDKIGKIVIADERKFANAIIEIMLKINSEMAREDCAKAAISLSFIQTGERLIELFNELLETAK